MVVVLYSESESDDSKVSHADHRRRTVRAPIRCRSQPCWCTCSVVFYVILLPPFSANKVDISTMAESNDNRFVAKAPDVEDRLKADTVGLVTLDDFRKRRAEAAEGGSGATTPDGR